MYIPETYAAALVLLILSMVCWGSWPKLLKALPNWRLEYFDLDYTIGFLITILISAATLGSSGIVGLDFLQRISLAGNRELGLAALGGFVWNLLAAIMMAGLVGIAISWAIGSGASWREPPGGSFWGRNSRVPTRAPSAASG